MTPFFPLVDDMKIKVNWIDFVLQIINKGKKVLLLIKLGQLQHDAKRSQSQMVVLGLSTTNYCTVLSHTSGVA